MQFFIERGPGGRRAMNRRELSILLPVALASLLCPRCALARPQNRGCVRSAAQGETAQSPALSSSGRPEVDEVCLREVANLNRIFEVRAAFGFYDDRYGENALASDGIHDRSYRDGTVLFGRRFASRLFDSAGSPIALIGVMGHEWAHILQYKAGLLVDWDVHHELSADYLSGWYLAHLAPVTDDRRAAAMQAFEGIGDTEFTSTHHHGTPSQRSKMFSAGYHLPESTTGVPTPPAVREALDLSLSFFN
jgi:hypothetical protein